MGAHWRHGGSVVRGFTSPALKTRAHGLNAAVRAPKGRGQPRRPWRPAAGPLRSRAAKHAARVRLSAWAVCAQGGAPRTSRWFQEAVHRQSVPAGPRFFQTPAIPPHRQKYEFHTLRPPGGRNASALRFSSPRNDPHCCKRRVTVRRIPRPMVMIYRL